MFGFVTASFKELTKEQKSRYGAVYCGICHAIKDHASQLSRINLSYDMTFLALLLMSLYEPTEQWHTNRCGIHPLRKRPWTDNEFVHYAADMNIALAYYNCLDDWQDDGNHLKKWMANYLHQFLPPIQEKYSRQCNAIETCIHQLSQLEQANCTNPDEPANCFGVLMAELLVYEEDLWAQNLRETGMALGRFIYLADATVDFVSDQRKKKYNPFVTADIGNRQQQEQHLLLAMGRCSTYYEKLPLVQDKALLDNILYSGVWTNLGQKRKEASAP